MPNSGELKVAISPYGNCKRRRRDIRRRASANTFSGSALEFNLDGSLLDYEAKMDMPEEMAQMTAQYCAAVSVLFNTLASSFTERSGMNWVPQHRRLGK